MAILAAVASIIVPKSYRASVIMSVVTDDGGSRMGGAASLMSQFGGLASLVGVTVSGGEKKAESQATLVSELLVGKFIQDNGLLPMLYADRWNPSSGAWKEGEGDEVPTLWEATQFFKRKVARLTTDPKTGLDTLSVVWDDAKVAAAWANGLVVLANDYLRTKAITEAESNIVYLNEQLSRTSVVAVQNSIASLLENEINRGMLARGNPEFAFRVIDPAVPPERPQNPGLLILTLLGLLVGLGGSIGYILLREY